MKATEDYLDLPYHFILEPTRGEEADEEPWWFIKVAELPGCMSQGRTPDEAFEQIRDAMLGWISVMQDEGNEIPEPWPDDMETEVVYFPVPVSVARRLRRRAREEHTRVEDLASAALAATVGLGQKNADAPAASSTAAG